MAEYPQVDLLRGISSGPREADINAILTILGTTTPFFAPFWEAAGSVVSVVGAGNLTSSDEATAITLQSEFAPVVMPCGLYHYGLIPSPSNLHLYAADAAAYSFGNGTVDTPFSGGLWIRPNITASKALLSKYRTTATAVREWRFGTDSSSKLFVELYDESADTTEIATANTALTVGQWVFVCFTYDGGETAPVINIYINAVLDNDGSSVESGAYVSMEDTSAEFMIGAHDVHSSPANVFSGRVAMPFITGKALSAAEVLSLYNLMLPMVGLDV